MSAYAGGYDNSSILININGLARCYKKSILRGLFLYTRWAVLLIFTPKKLIIIIWWSLRIYRENI